MSKQKTRYPFAYREAYGEQPVEVRGMSNSRTEYYWTQLEKMVMSLVDIECPKEWDKDYVREGLLLKGMICVTEVDGGVVLPLKCGAYGVNVFNRATNVVIANPVIGSFERVIGKDCELIYLQQKQGARFRNLRPVISLFAQKLANCDSAIDVNLFNSKTPYIFQAPSSQVAESFKAMFDEVNEGNPAVFIDEELGKMLGSGDNDSLYMVNVKNNFVADLVQNEKMQIINEFLTTVGINTANRSKREREVVDEVNANNMEVECNVKLWKQNVEDCVERVNAMFPEVGLKITFPYYEAMESDNRPDADEVGQPEEKGEDSDKEGKEDESD